MDTGSGRRGENSPGATLRAVDSGDSCAGIASRKPPGRARAGGKWKDLLWLLPVVALWSAVRGHALTLGFVGDDFQWWQHARMALQDPTLLFDNYGGFRPLNTWTLAFDQLIWGTNPFGYHLTNLLLHLACGLMLWWFLSREGFSAPARLAVVTLWLCSPFTEETAVFVAARFEPVMALLWLGLAVLWPQPGEEWTGRRTAAAVIVAGLTIVTKESWVVLPGFGLAFDLFLARTGLRKALVHSSLAAAAVAVYLVLYLTHPAIQPGEFFQAGAAGALKVPHAWAAFLGLRDLAPVAFPFGLPEACGLAVMLLLGWLAWRRRWSLVGVGFAFFLLPFLPILPVGWMTSRYTTIPLLGFLIVVAASARGAIAEAPERWRLAGRVAAGSVALLLLLANLVWLRGDRTDAQRLWQAHRRLLGEAEAFLPELPLGLPLVAVRAERENPLLALSLASKGVPKLYYVRGAGPYAMADWGALFSYLLEPRGGPMLVEASGSVGPGEYAVVAHVAGRFVRIPPQFDSADSEAASWRAKALPVTVLRPFGIRPRSRP
jgi:hypothetical protein